jgi:hypothetical protein
MEKREHAQGDNMSIITSFTQTAFVVGFVFIIAIV